ncbi:MAG: hypothetical protein ABIJ37_04580 [Pseudomonadota bacterium]
MLDISIAYNRYKFLGYEFLTWLWYLIEKEQRTINEIVKEPIFLEIGNRIVLENLRKEVLESVTIRGDDAGLEEGIMALRKGAVVTEINLIYKDNDFESNFTIKGESLDISGLRVPKPGYVESRKDLEGAVIEKAYLCNRVLQLIDNLFKQFIRLRNSKDWVSKVVPHIRQWIHS